MRIVYTSLLLSLGACAILGDPKDPNENATGTSSPDTSSSSSSSTSATSSGGETTTVDTTGTTTTGFEPTTALTIVTVGDQCYEFAELHCDIPGCRPVYGTPFDFPGCTPEPAFLGCIPEYACDDALTVVCRDNSLEVYQIPDTCIPPDFSTCDTMLSPCGDDCVGLDETDCLMETGCSPHYGAPHMVQDDMVCADFNAPEFLACDKAHPPCPPTVLTVCPIGQPDTAFEVASGCLPPGFENCGDGATPECP